MDAAESLPDMLWSSLLWPSASYGTEPCMPADCAATFASRRVQVVCLPLWKLNHEFQWLAIDTDMDGAAMCTAKIHQQRRPASWIPAKAKEGAGNNSATWRSYVTPWRFRAQRWYTIEMGKMPKLYMGKVTA